MKSLNQFLVEFQGWPAWDDEFEITSPFQAADLIKQQKDFQRSGFRVWYDNIKYRENKALWDYLSSDLELEDKLIISSELKLTGMLCKDSVGFDFVEPIKGTISAYTDEIGDSDVSITYAYFAQLCPKEFDDFRENGKDYVYINSQDLDKRDFEKRNDKLPKRGLAWAFSTYSSTVPGYWCKDNSSKKDMMKYCDLIELKKGKIVS